LRARRKLYATAIAKNLQLGWSFFDEAPEIIFRHLMPFYDLISPRGVVRCPDGPHDHIANLGGRPRWVDLIGLAIVDKLTDLLKPFHRVRYLLFGNTVSPRISEVLRFSLPWTDGNQMYDRAHVILENGLLCYLPGMWYGR